MKAKSILVMLSATIVWFTLSACQLGVNDANQDPNQQSITIFSERHYDTDRVLYDLFEAETGIQVNLVRDGADPLLSRLENEGEDTIADVLLVADAGSLERAKNRDLLLAIESPFLNEHVPQNYRDIDGYWYGVSARARVLVYHPERVDVNALSTYEALIEPAWEGRVVTRSSTNIYNQSLMASFIEVMGDQGARDFASGLVANFAKSPSGNDRAQALSVLSGEADVAIMNTYYIGVMLNSGDATQIEAAASLKLFFPNQGTTGTHVNASAAGVVKHSSNPELATQFIEFLLSETAQRHFTTNNFEYPVNPNVEWDSLLLSWGTFVPQDINLAVLGENNNRAKEIMDQVGWR